MDIKSIRESNKDFLTYNSRGYNVSQEYTKVDWPNFLLGPVNTLYRAITNGSKTTVDHPGLMIALFLSKPAKIIDALKMLNVHELAKQLIDAARGSKNSLAYAFDKDVLNKAPNAYYIFFSNYKKTKNLTKDQAESIIKEFKTAVESLKTLLCKKISVRSLTTSEISDIKKFRPELAKREMETALKWIEHNNPDIYKIANDLAEWVTKNMIQYLSDGIYED